MIYAFTISSGVAALIGAVVGGGITIIVSWIQQRSHSKREFIKMAYDLAKADYISRKELAKPGSRIMPLDSYVPYYLAFLSAVHSKNFKVENLKEVRKLRDELNVFYKNDK